MAASVLVVVSRARDRADFEEFANAGAQRWLRLAHALSGDWHLAQDVVQTVLAKLYADWPRLGRAQSPDAYVRRCVINALNDERRRPWRRERFVIDRTPPAPDTSSGRALDHVEHRVELVAALRQLPSGQRAVLVLRYLEDLDIAETARVLGCSTGNVKSQTARGLEALRRVMPVNQGGHL